MIHSYSLIDDLPSIDNDDIRRGKPTCHKIFGEATALLAGDGLLTEAFRVMSDNRYTERTNPRIIKQLIFEISSAAGAMGMVGGQVMDVLSDGRRDRRIFFITSILIKATTLLSASVRIKEQSLAAQKLVSLKSLRNMERQLVLLFR